MKPHCLTSPRRAGPAVVFVAVLAVTTLSEVESAGAVPRYSAMIHQKCGLCHVNPSGGGMRSLYATQYLVPRELAWNAPKPEFLKRYDPRIGKSLTIGADMRLMNVRSDDQVQTGDFFQMQGDVYLAFELGKAMSLYMDRGLSTTGEIYGLAYIPPLAGGYVKAGRFIPPFGWKFGDHTAYVRSELGFTPPAHSDVGVEIGASPGRSDIQIAVTNGNRGATLATDAQYATWLNATYRVRVSAAHVALGVTAFREPHPTETTRAGGAHGYAAMGPVTWITQANWFRRYPSGAPAQKGFVASNQFSLRVRRGLDLLGSYDFLDPDERRDTGTRARWGVGASLFWSAFSRIEVWYRCTSVHEGPAVSGPDAYQTIVQAHLLY